MNKLENPGHDPVFLSSRESKSLSPEQQVMKNDPPATIATLQYCDN
jgi:hypothetical protein